MTDLTERLNAALGDRYRIERRIGAGGMATVYLAEDVKHGRNVALKVLTPEVAAAVGAERFLREIEIVAGLRHPNILPLYDSGEADGLLYYVMPFVEEGSLRDRLQREVQLPIEDCIRIATEVADALATAHDSALVHRDIKPENIMLERGHAVVTDFGIALALEAGAAKLTHTGVTVGTAEYMSPEQAMAMDAVDSRTDIYSLGCVLYEMLVGVTPFSGATARALFARKAVEPVPSLTLQRETVPAAVEAAVVKAMAKVPADRFATARDFAAALTDPDRAVRSPAPPTPPRVRRAAWLAAGFAAAVVAVVVYGTSQSGAGNTLRATFGQVTAQPGVEDSPSLSADGEWVAYAGGVGQNRDIYLQNVGGRLPINLTADSPDDDYQPEFSPDGERIAFRSSRDGGGLFLMGRTGEAVRRVTDVGFDPTWAPDGSQLAFATEGVGLLPLNWDGLSFLFIADVETAEVRPLEGAGGVQPSWSPDGSRIAYTRRLLGVSQMDIWTVPAAGGEPVALTTDTHTDWSPTWSRDGRYVYFSSDRGGAMNLWRVPIDQESGQSLGEPEPVTTPSTFVAHPSLSSDGRTIAYASVQMIQNVQKATLDLSAGALTDLLWLTTGSRQWSSPDWGPNGDWVVFYSRDLPEGDLYVVRSTGSGLRQVTGDQALDRMPRWSPTADRIAYFSNRSGALQLWGIRGDGSGDRQIAFGNGSGFGAWSPDGSRFVVNSVGEGTLGEVLILDPDIPWEAQAIDTLPTPDSTIGQFIVNSWSPDGRRLAGFVGPLADDGLVVYDTQTRTYERLTDYGQWPVWLPDSRTLLFVTGGTQFILIDTQTRETRTVHTVFRDVLGPPRITEDGQELVFTRRVTESDVWIATLDPN